MKTYTLGFVLNPPATHVLLLQKNRPPFLAGLFNGIGGKIEDGETPAQAMARECQEETGLILAPEAWEKIGILSDDITFEVHVFAACAPLGEARAMTDETVHHVPLDQVATYPLAPSVGDMLRTVQGRFSGQVPSNHVP